ncbi:MAG: hypothetical protein NTU51_02225 [Bacteroidetes bacterium]|nr:hypothetical protein [Bacteroidota bacterium]
MKKLKIVRLFPEMLVITCLVYGMFFNTEKVYGGDNQKSNPPSLKYPCYYHEKFSADGWLGDWPTRMFYDNTDARLTYAVANDSSRLYFCVQILHQAEQMSVLHEGLTFAIEADGKKKYKCVFQFPYGMVKPYGSPAGGPGDRTDAGQPGTNGEVRGQGNPPDNQSQPKSKVKKGMEPAVMGSTPVVRQKPRRLSAGIKLSGFQGDVDGIYPPDSMVRGVETAIAYDSSGCLVLEAAIPLSYFTKDLRMAKFVLFGFVLKSSQGGPPQDGSEGRARGGMQGGGPGGGGQGGMGGGPGGGGQGGMGGMGGGPGGGGQGGMGGMGGGPGGGQGGMGSGPGGPPQDSGSQSQTKNYKISHKFSIAPMP